jgi:hypothetical protein
MERGRMTLLDESENDEAVDWEEVSRSNFAARLVNSAAWFETFDELWVAAELIAPQVH